MGDRSNPIKFGPEWLRNLAPGASGSGNNNHNSAMQTSPILGGASGGPPGGNTSANTFSPKVLLAKLRYGREEMLALYDRTSEAPPELKYIETLYQPRGKPPLALNNSFEDEMRENMRSGPPLGASPGERFGIGRGLGRGINVSDGRGRGRVPFVRQPSTGRGCTVRLHGAPKMPGYSGGADDDSLLNLRSSWSVSNGGSPHTPNRNTGEQAEWTPNKMFRSKRQGQATNWRQAREEGEEWRDAGRSRGNNQQEKWERDWGDRQGQDKSQTWNSNRRTWVGGDTQNDDNLPEWAVDNAEACGGTFDSSGAFHGYSNDDTNLPKNQDSAYPLTRSHTHGSFARSKTVEEGSEEWWASEKAKKLSPKRFDASDVKFKKQTSVSAISDTSSDLKSAVAKDDQQQELSDMHGLDSLESLPTFASEATEISNVGNDEDKLKNPFKPKFSESKTFDSLLRSDISLEDSSDDRSNFQSVMITPNNSLRQKHQNIVSAASEMPVRDSNSGKPGIHQLMQNSGNPPVQYEISKHQSPEDKIMDDIFDMTLEEKVHKHSKPISSPLMNQPASSISSPMASIVNSMPPLPNSAMQLRMPNPVFSNTSLMSAKPNMTNSPQGAMPAGLQSLPAGLQGLPAGLQIAGLPPSLAGMQSMGMQGGGMPSSSIQGGNQTQVMAGTGIQTSSMQGNQLPSGMQGNQLPSGMQGNQLPSGMQGNQLPSGMQGNQLPSGMQGNQLPSGMQGNQLPSGMQGNQLPSGMQVNQLPSGMQGNQMPSGMQGNQLPSGMQVNQLPSGMQGGIQQALQGSGMQGPGLQGPGLQSSSLQGSGMQQGGIQNSGMQSLQSVGITNSALNASLGLPIRPGGNPIGLPIQGVPTPVVPNSAMGNAGLGGSGMQNAMGGGQVQPGTSGLQGFPNTGGIPGISSANSSLFMPQNSSNPALGSPGDIPMPNQHAQSNMFPMHGLQHSGSQAAFGSSIYSNMMQQPPAQPPPNAQNPGELWYYEDPKKNIQGPFSSQEMYNWYRAGFFNPSLMVRRTCDTHMRPLGSYGPVVPFAQMDMLSTYQLTSGFDRSPGPHESMLNSQQALGLESVMNITNLNDPTMDSMQFGSVGPIINPPFGQQQPMDSLWSQPSPSQDLLWMQQAMSRNDNQVNNLPMYFWDQQPSAIASNALLPEEIAKEMKTEDQILAQLRASQNIGTPQGMQYMNDQPPVSSASAKMEEGYLTTTSATPDMEELHKLIQKDTLTAKTVSDSSLDISMAQSKSEITTKVEPETEMTKPQPQVQQPPPPQPLPQHQTLTKPVPETKQAKQAKNETEKATKTKENSASKTKSKKKEEKKDDLESKPKEEDVVKSEKRSDEPSPAKSKKEDKSNKKELEKEKKEWLKEGFTIVKGSEKSSSKDNKKKVEEAKVAEEAERKRKEEERLVAEEDKKRKQAEAAFKKQQENQQHQQRQAAESVVKKAPWSAVSNQNMTATTKDGLSLTEIQRLEREKKLEQIKEQQQMMQIIAQQQAAALAREQEMQAGLGWAKKKGNNTNNSGQSLAEIQAEARKQAATAAAAVAAAAAAQALEEVVQPPINHVPWGNATNGASGFWDTQPNQPSKSMEKTQESPKAAEPKKKRTISAAVKKETSPAVEFESWCTTVLTSWSSKIDVPTFVGFLKDIESPYEVKDYVKCYLGESKDSSDFSRQFLERRSKLLRVGMVTPSDDLCSPAMAVNPRASSNSDYQEVKGKGKKTKKNKMLKVDARILGFSVTASEDRINVGDIDTV